jgi:HSP20 family protein
MAKQKNEKQAKGTNGPKALHRREDRGEPGSRLVTTPFAFMKRFGEEMDRLFEDFGLGSGWLTPILGREFGESIWAPQVEMFERDGQLVVRADLPGLTKDDVKVELADDAITIEGERRGEHEEKREGYYRSERSYGKFYRRLPVPEGVNAENASASFRHGVLEITMPAPQHAERKARKLEINAEAEPKTKVKAAGK